MGKLNIIFWIGLIFLLPIAGFAQEEEEEEKVLAPSKSSPFTAILWQADEPMVYFEKEWYFVDSIYDFSAGDLLKYCREEEGSRWQRAFGEKLVEICEELNNPITEEVDLKLIDRAGKVHYFQGKLTEENRDDIKHFRDDDDLMDEILRPDPEKALTRKEVAEDLELLKTIISRFHSYARIRDYDYEAAIDSTIDQLPASMTPEALGLLTQRLIAPLGDGHGRVLFLPAYISFDESPIRFKYYKDELLVFDNKTDKLLSSRYPFLESVNGVSRANLIKQAMSITPDGSAAYKIAKSERYLVLLDFLLREENAYNKQLTIKLKNESGKTTTVSRKLIPLEKGQRPSTIPERVEGSVDVSDDDPYDFKILSGNIGYLKIPLMSNPSDLDEMTEDVMEDAEDTEGLIIDLRDNPGGQRRVLRYLGPYFVDPDGPPHIANLAVLRTEYPITQGGMDLSRRYLYMKGDDHWNTSEYRAIKEFEKTFTPKWEPLVNQFGPWHYYVLNGDDAEYFYDKPVVVLINEFSFSAADVFVGALKGLPNVTLAGTCSSGGSGRSQDFYLLNSGIKVKLCTMASFQPDGNLFDTVGVEPEVELEETLDDILGNSDSQLERAIDLLK